MRKFERLGMSRDQAESLTRSMTEIMCVNKEKIAEQFVSKASLEKVGLHSCFDALLSCLQHFDQQSFCNLTAGLPAAP